MLQRIRQWKRFKFCRIRGRGGGLELRIHLVDHPPPVLGSEAEHALNLEQRDSLDQGDEHAYAKQKQADDQPTTEERHSTTPRSIDPRDRSKGVEEGGGKDSH